MTKENIQKLNQILERLGFTIKANPKQTTITFNNRAPSTKTATSFNQKNRSHLPKKSPLWIVDKCRIASKSRSFSWQEICLLLDKTKLFQELDKSAQKMFGHLTLSEFFVNNEGKVWCLFQFFHPNAIKKSNNKAKRAAHKLAQPIGLGGFSFRFSSSENGLIHIVLSHHFGVGYLPQKFLPNCGKLVLQTLANGYSDPNQTLFSVSSLFEAKFNLLDLMWEGLMDRAKLLANGDEYEPEVLQVKKLYHNLKKPESSRSRIVYEKNMWRLSFNSTKLPEPSDIFGDGSLPVEVLESRELVAKFSSLDDLIQQNDATEAMEIVTTSLNEYPNSLYLLRRLALLLLSGRCQNHREITARYLNRALELDQSNKLFLSAGIALSFSSKNDGERLRLLSSLGKQLNKEIEDAEKASSFEVVLPELLGDAWQHENLEKAVQCYNRVLERRGDLPRVLHKLIEIAKITDNRLGEIGYLKRLANVERRNKELSEIHLRLAELAATSTTIDEAITLGLKSLTFNEVHVPSALLVAELLIRSGKAERALQLLDRIQNKIKDDKKTTLIQSHLESQIGSIWLSQLNRPDLAEARFLNALKLNENNDEARGFLLELYQIIHDFPKLADLLEWQLSMALKEGGSDQDILSIKEKLQKIYSGPLDNKEKIYQLHLRTMDRVLPRPEEIEDLILWKDTHIDWLVFLNLLNRQLSQTKVSNLNDYYLVMSHILHRKLHKVDEAVSFLLKSAEDRPLSQVDFDILITYLKTNKKYEEITKYFDQRLSKVTSKEERVNLLLEYLAIPKGISASKRDLLTVEIYKLDHNHERAILKRLQYYRETDDINGLDSFLSLVLEQNPPFTKKIYFIRYTNELLVEIEDHTKFSLLDKNFRLLLEIEMDQKQVLNEAIKVLATSGQPKILEFYVSELLSLNELPDSLTEEDIIQIIETDRLSLARYYEQLSLRATDNSQAADFARMAKDYYLTCTTEKGSICALAMSARICSLVQATTKELNELRRLSEANANWQLYANVLSTQISLTPEAEGKIKLLEIQGKLYYQRLHDNSKAKRSFFTAQSLSQKPYYFSLLLADLARKTNNKPEEIANLRTYLETLSSFKDTDSIFSTIERLSQLGEDRSKITGYIRQYIDESIQNKEMRLAGYLCDLAINLDLSSLDLFKQMFKVYELVNERTKAKHFWLKGLSLVSIADLYNYLAETKSFLETQQIDANLEGYVDYVLTNQHAEAISPEINRELRLIYGNILFEAENSRRASFELFKSLYAEDANDSRCFVPLYFLYREFGTAQERFDYLRKILPQLNNNQDLLKNSPITLESLRSEYNKLEYEQKIGRLKNQDEQPKKVAEPSPFSSSSPPAVSRKKANESGKKREEIFTDDQIIIGAKNIFELDRLEQHHKNEHPSVSTGGNLSKEIDNIQKSSPEKPNSELAVTTPSLKDAEPIKFTLKFGENIKNEAADENISIMDGEKPQDSAPKISLDSPKTVKENCPDQVDPEPSDNENQSNEYVPQYQRDNIVAINNSGIIPKPADSLNIINPEEIKIEFANSQVAGEPAGFSLTPDDVSNAPKLEEIAALELRLETPNKTAQDDNVIKLEDIQIAPDISNKSIINDEDIKVVNPADDILKLNLSVGDIKIEEKGGQDELDLVKTSEVPPPTALPDGVISAESSELNVASFTASVPKSAIAPLVTGQAISIEGNPNEETAIASLEQMKLDLVSLPNMQDQNDDIQKDEAPQKSNMSTYVIDDLPADEPAREIDSKKPEETNNNVDLGFIPLSPPVEDAQNNAAQNEAAIGISEHPKPQTSNDSQVGSHITKNETENRQLDIIQNDEAEENIDWKKVVLEEGGRSKQAASSLMKQAFANELEKHIAIQATALVTGRMEALNEWHWKVWRHGNEFGYKLIGREHYPTSADSTKILDSLLHKYILTITPLLLTLYRTKFTLEGLAQLLKTNIIDIGKSRKYVKWNDGLLGKTGFAHFRERLEKRRYIAYSLPGLGDHIFYEGKNRTIYFDEQYYEKAPPGHLLHRVLKMLWSVKLKYFVALKLDPKQEVLPILVDLRSGLEASGISKLKNVLGVSLSKVDRALNTLPDKDIIRNMTAKIGEINEVQLVTLWKGIDEYLNGLILAETLNLVGLVESITNKDLLKIGPFDINELYSDYPEAKQLIEFATKLLF